MKLNPVLESLDSLPEDFRENYAQGEDGKYHLTLLGEYIPKESVEDVSGLKKALGQERDAAAAAKRRLKELEEQYGGVDLEEIKKFNEEKQRLEEEKAKQEGRWDDLKRQLNEAHKGELTKRDEQIAAMQSTLENFLVDGEASRAIAGEDGYTALLLPHVKSQTRVVQTDSGQYTVRVVDAEGKPRVNAQGDYMTINELVSEMRTDEQFSAAFKAKQRPGGGGTPPGEGSGAGGGGGSIPKDAKRSSLDTRAKKISYIKEHGKEAFDALPYD